MKALAEYNLLGFSGQHSCLSAMWPEFKSYRHPNGTKEITKTRKETGFVTEWWLHIEISTLSHTHGLLIEPNWLSLTSAPSLFFLPLWGSLDEWWGGNFRYLCLKSSVTHYTKLGWTCISMSVVFNWRKFKSSENISNFIWAIFHPKTFFHPTTFYHFEARECFSKETCKLKITFPHKRHKNCCCCYICCCCCCCCYICCCCCCRCHICHFCCCLLAPVVNDFTFVKVVNANAAAFVIVLLLHLSLLLLLLLMLFLLPHLSFLDAVVVVAVTFVVAVVLSKCFLSRLYSLCLHF